MLGNNERIAALESRLRGIESTLQEILRVMRLPEDVRAAEYHALQSNQEALRRAMSNQGMAALSNPYSPLGYGNNQCNGFAGLRYDAQSPRQKQP